MDSHHGESRYDVCSVPAVSIYPRSGIDINRTCECIAYALEEYGQLQGAEDAGDFFIRLFRMHGKDIRMDIIFPVEGI